MPRWVFAVLLCLPLAGCGSNGVTPDVVVKIVAALSASAVLADRRTKSGAAFRQFVQQRTVYLTGKNASWATEANYASLSARLGSEMDSLLAVIAERQATITGAGGGLPAHCDLDDAAKRLVTDGPSSITRRSATFKQDRSDRIAQIVWRAGAVHPELWAGGDATLTPVLNKPPLLEVLDRRLRIVEMMALHDGGDIGNWTVAGAGAGWNDQQRTALFEYPWVNLNNASGTAVFENALTAAGLTLAGLAPTFNVVVQDSRIYYGPSQNRPRPPAAADWTVSDKPYVLTYAAAGSAAAAMERLVPSAAKTDPAFEDFWQRNWFYCDMMIAALHVDSLRFARRRRTGTDGDFDSAAGSGITLRPLIPRVGAPTPAALMGKGADWFEGVSIPHDQLQIGDHLVYWNSPFVRHLLGSAFGLENSLVMRIDTDGSAVTLAGHGEPELNEKAFADELSSEIKSAYVGLRRFINGRFATDTTVAFIALVRSGIRFQLVRWAPFNEDFTPAPGGALTADGAWWIRLRRDQIHDDGQPPPSLAEALAAVPLSVAVDRTTQAAPPLPAADHDADFHESVYLPLSVPKGLRGGWKAYFASPRAGQTVLLEDLIPDGQMVPGFFANGPASTIPVFRPRLGS